MPFDPKTFHQLADTTQSDLVNHRLHDAITTLRALLDSEYGTGVLRRELTTVEGDYERLLHYMTEGAEDGSREAMHLRFIQKTFKILQNLRQLHAWDETSQYALLAKSVGEKWKSMFEGTMDSLSSENNYELQDLLFNLIWIAPQLNQNEERQLRLFLLASTTKLRSYMLSALSLSLLHFFDAAKVRLLMEYALSEAATERSRAIVGLTLTTQIYGDVLSLYPRLVNGLQQLAKKDLFMEGVAALQHHICLYLESERLQKKMEEEILPNLVRATQERIRLGFSPEEEEDDIISSKQESKIDKELRKRVSESAQEMFRMFQEGVDVNLHTFTALKAFPFFHQVCHWLAPFDEHRPEVSISPTILKMHAGLCDSDRYSICMMSQRLPEEKKKEIRIMLEEHAEDIENHTREVVPMEDVQNVVQCLYRLLRRSPWQSMWPAIFTESTLFINNAIIGDALRNNPQFVGRTGNTLFRHGRFQQAERHLRLLADLVGTDTPLLTQMAFCKERQGQFLQAIRLYQDALILTENDPLALFHLQFCYANLGRHRERLEPLYALERLNPDDPKILTETGLCLMQLEEWSEAQRRFYKMEFKGQRVVPSLRAIAWCALQMKDLETAKRHYERIFSEFREQARWEDYLNKGHVCWCMGNIQEAIGLYHEYAERYVSDSPKVTDALAPFNIDARVLMKNGKSASDIALMHDLIERSLHR